MSKLIIPPNEATYVVQDGSESVSVILDGGASRTRRDKINAWRNATVQWSTSPAGYDYLQAFYRFITAKGTAPFTIDLIFDHSFLEEYNAKFIIDSFRLSSVQGLTYTVDASIECFPISTDYSDDEAVILAYEEYGDNASTIFNLLEHLVNHVLPDNLGS